MNEMKERYVFTTDFSYIHKPTFHVVQSAWDKLSDTDVIMAYAAFQDWYTAAEEGMTIADGYEARKVIKEWEKYILKRGLKAPESLWEEQYEY